MATTQPPPKAHEAWRLAQIAAVKEGGPPPPRPTITDDEIRQTIENGQLRVQNGRGIDLTIFSPRTDPPLTDRWWYSFYEAMVDLDVPAMVSLLRDHLLRNVYFDTCVYHRPGTELLAKVIPVENILFASETIGAVQGIDPETGHHYEDTKRYIDAVRWLTDADRHRIYEANARAMYGRLSAQMKRQLQAAADA